MAKTLYAILYIVFAISKRGILRLSYVCNAKKNFLFDQGKAKFSWHYSITINQKNNKL